MGITIQQPFVSIPRTSSAGVRSACEMASGSATSGTSPTLSLDEVERDLLGQLGQRLEAGQGVPDELVAEEDGLACELRAHLVRIQVE